MVPVLIHLIVCIRVHVIVLYLLLELNIDPEHADVKHKDRECENAILVIGQVDRGLHEEQQEYDDAGDHHLAVVEDIFLSVFYPISIVVITPTISIVLNLWCFTNGSHCDHERKVKVVGDPGIYGGERHVNRDEIDEAHHISSIVFVLEWLVDKILNDDLEQDVGNDWQKQQKHVLELVHEDEGRESYSQG